MAAIATPAFAQGDAAAGETIFKRCAACHSIGEGAKNKVGPILTGVVGRVAGTEADFKYSDAMTAAGAGGLTWTPEELHAFLTAPKTKVPGTKMSFPGLKTPEDLDNIVAYLLTFSPDYKAP
jgi:cytochrome c